MADEGTDVPEDGSTSQQVYGEAVSQEVGVDSQPEGISSLLQPALEAGGRRAGIWVWAGSAWLTSPQSLSPLRSAVGAA